MSEQMTSNKPYIVRAFYEWIVDNELTPYIAVDTSVYGVIVPLAYIHDNQIVLNIAPVSVGAISLAGDNIEFSARFGGKLENLVIPYAAISAIYAKENGAGTQLAVEHIEADNALSTSADEPTESKLSSVATTTSKDNSEDKPTKASKSRARLKVVK
jgi:stringent starvation protein B